MTVDWINAVWEENLTKHIKATDSSFDKYKCPVFMNVIVTATDLSKQEKLEIKNLISAHGGVSTVFMNFLAYFLFIY